MVSTIKFFKRYTIAFTLGVVVKLSSCLQPHQHQQQHNQSLRSSLRGNNNNNNNKMIITETQQQLMRRTSETTLEDWSKLDPLCYSSNYVIDLVEDNDNDQFVLVATTSSDENFQVLCPGIYIAADEGLHLNRQGDIKIVQMLKDPKEIEWYTSKKSIRLNNDGIKQISLNDLFSAIASSRTKQSEQTSDYYYSVNTSPSVGLFILDVLHQSGLTLSQNDMNYFLDLETNN